jgi:Ca2+-binding RTX toxin-like protein
MAFIEDTQDGVGRSLSGTNETDYIYGFGGDDILFGFGDIDFLHGGDGNDLIYGGDGSDQAYGGNGEDSLFGEAGEDELFGEAGNDLLYGGSGGDVAHGGDGNDYIFGEGGDDYDLDGGRGNDTISGGLGNDIIKGGDGFDRIWESGNANFQLTDTQLIGSNGYGTDSLDSIEEALLVGGAGNNRIDASGFSGSTLLYGNLGRDVLIGGSTTDQLVGGDGLTFYGLASNDSDDTLIGNAGNDYLWGEGGDDILIGVDPTAANPGRGERDELTGGTGSDLFVLGGRAANLGDEGQLYYHDDDPLDFNAIVYDPETGQFKLNRRPDGYAKIKDFEDGDLIQLASGYTYSLKTTSLGVGIYADVPSNLNFVPSFSGPTTRRELIGVVENVSLGDLDLANSSQFVFS